MGLKFYVSDAQARSSLASQLNGQAGQAIASLQSSVQLFLSAPLSSKAYNSAKSYFMIAYTPLCHSAIMTGEALESAHKKFLSDYQGSVSGIDTDEDLILEEISRLEQLKQSLDQQMSTAKNPRPDLERRYMNACDVIRQRQEKLAKFHAYDGRSANIFSEYQTCQQEFNSGIAQVKNCTAWNSASGTFDVKKLNMSWAKPINKRWKQREKMRQEKLNKMNNPFFDRSISSSEEYMTGSVKNTSKVNFDLKKGNLSGDLSGEASGAVIKGKVKGKFGLLSGSVEESVGKVGVSGKVKGTAFKNGLPNPELTLEGKAHASGINGKVDGKLGTSNNNVHGSGTGNIGYAEASGKLNLSDKGFGAEGKVEVAALEGQAKGGITLFGVTVDVTGKGKLGAVGFGGKFGGKEDEINVGADLSILAGLGLDISIKW